MALDSDIFDDFPMRFSKPKVTRGPHEHFRTFPKSCEDYRRFPRTSEILDLKMFLTHTKKFKYSVRSNMISVKS